VKSANKRLSAAADPWRLDLRLGGSAGGVAQLVGKLDRDRHYAVTPTAALETPRWSARSRPPLNVRARVQRLQPVAGDHQDDPLVVADVAALGELGQDRRG